MLILLLLIMGMSSHGSEPEQEGQVALFRSDVRKGWRKLMDLTSASHKRLVLGVILVGAALRISQLWQGITYDEAFTVTFYATRPVNFILSDYTWPNNHLLHTLLVKCAIAVFGVHPWSVRLPGLIAGILVMPLFYAFVRVMFNRYIALLALSFVAASGALIEYSALARGYSLTWLFMMAALLAGRHFVKRNNPVSAGLVAVFCALGMWAVPTMVYAAMAVYFWLALYLISLYDSTLNKRLFRLMFSFIGFWALSAAVYTPVIMVHSLDHLLHHPMLGDSSWASFVLTHQDKAFDLWGYFNDTAATWISFVGIAGLIYAAYISTKYRIMVLSTLLAAIPLVLLRSNVDAPRTWTYVLFNLHLSSAIALFYALKLVQEKVYAGFTKRFRTVLMSVIVLVGMSWLGITGPGDRVERFSDVRRAAAWFNGVLKPGDRVLAMDPNDAPFEFHLITEGLDRDYMGNGVATTGRFYVLVSPAQGQTIEKLLEHRGMSDVDARSLVKVKDWKRLEIWTLP